MKKFLAVFLSIVMILTVFPLTGLSDLFNFSITASAKDVFNSGYCGDTSNGSNGQNLAWVIDSNGVLTITGSGRMANYVEYVGTGSSQTYEPSSPWYGDLRITSVVLDGNIENIGDYAFLRCDSLTSVDFGTSLVSIGKGSFKRCNALETIAIPNTVTSMGKEAFERCDALASVTLSTGITVISESAFYWCPSLSSVTVSSALTKIGRYAFYLCSALEEINLPDTVTTIEQGAFSGSGLTEFRIPEGVTAIEEATFSGCTSLSSLIASSNLTTIGMSAFSGCTALETIDLPDTVSVIRGHAFQGAGLTEFTFPESMTTIEEAVFSETRISNIVIPDNIITIGANAYYLIKAPINSVVIGNNVKSIGLCCITEYSGYTSTVTELILPDSLESLGSGAIQLKSITSINIGKNLREFENSLSNDGMLEEITISPENPYLHSYDNAVYNSDYSEILWFNKNRTGTLTFPKELKNFEYDCLNNPNIHISNFEIEDGAQYFAVEDGILYSKDMTELYRCPNGRSRVIHLPSTVTTIKRYAVAWTSSFVDFSTNNNNLKTIEEGAFRGNNGCFNLVLPEGIETIGKDAFGVTYFRSVVLPDSLQEIYPNSISCFDYLKSIHFGANTKIVGSAKNVFNHSKFEEYTVSEDNPYYAAIDGVLYSKDLKTFYSIPRTKTSIHLPAQLESFVGNLGVDLDLTVDENNPNIKKEGPLLLSMDGTILYWIQNVEDVVIPGTVQTYEGSTSLSLFSTQGVALGSNSKLKNLTYSEGCTSIFTIKTNSIERLSLPGSMKRVVGTSNSVFTNYRSLKEIELNEGIEYINAFGNTSLTELTLPFSCKYFVIGGTGTSILGQGTTSADNLERIIVKNPNCQFYNIEGLNSNTEIHGYCGSTAHKLAVKRQAIFVSLGHDYLDWYTVTPATYDAPGVERRDCAYCDHYEEREIPQLVSDTHTATFVASGKVVATVDFYSTMTEIEEPEVPAKDRYIGEWEDYTLGDTDITINAVYTLIKSDSAADINTESSVDYYYDTDDIQFKLKASAAAKTVKTTIYQSVPLDIVLVVDQSGSMADTLGSSQTKLDALKASANSFINQVAENARLTGANHRIAIVGFGLAGSYTGYQLNENSEILTSSAGIVGYANITPAIYSSALLNVLNGNALNADLTQAINSIEARGATAADLGLEMAKGIFANTDSTDRQRVVVFMTDGEPTYTNGFQMSVANSAVYNASLLKNIYNASVYSVGVLDSEQRTNPYVDMFMKAVSSDYPDAVSFKNLGRRESEHFFITVDNTDSLSDVFTTISTESLSHTATFDKITFIKTLSSNVTLTSGQEHDMREYLIRHYGISNSDITVTRNADGTTFIKVSNLSPKEVEMDDGTVIYEVSFSFFASLNENAATAGEYYVDTDDSGVMLDENSNGYEAVFEPSKITLESDKTRFIFRINNEVYEIGEGANASEAKPDTEFPSDWNFSGWSASTSQTTNGTVVDATLTKLQRTVTWHTDTDTIVQNYCEGDFINALVGTDKADGTKFLSWNKSIPTVMPDNNLEFTAIYGDHVHKYTSGITTPATCTEDGVMTYTCICGDTYTETIPATGHNYEAVTPSNENESSKCEFVCTHCGERYEYALNYEIREANFGRSHMLYEFNLTDENLITGFEPDGTIYVRIPLTEIQSRAKFVYVVRNNADGTQTSVPARIENGYMIIEADHFSSYEINLTYNCENLGDHVDADGDGYCDYCNESLDPDFNSDGIIDVNDIGFMLSAAVGKVDENDPRFIKADLNGDGVVDAFDAAWLDKLLYSPVSPPNPTELPQTNITEITPVTVNTITPDSAIQISTDQTPAEIAGKDYADWDIDLVLTFNQAVNKNDIYIFGQYGTYDWAGDKLADSGSLAANEEFSVIHTWLPTVLGTGSFALTYTDIVTDVRDFKCAIYANNPSSGLEATIKLVATEPNGTVHVLDTYTCSF